jgi:hypothetical protein
VVVVTDPADVGKLNEPTAYAIFHVCVPDRSQHRSHIQPKQVTHSRVIIQVVDHDVNHLASGAECLVHKAIRVTGTLHESQCTDTLLTLLSHVHVCLIKLAAAASPMQQGPTVGPKRCEQHTRATLFRRQAW